MISESKRTETMKLNKHVYSFSWFVFPTTRHYAELWSIALVPSEFVMFYFLFSQRMEKSEVELVRKEGEEDLLLEQEKT